MDENKLIEKYTATTNHKEKIEIIKQLNNLNGDNFTTGPTLTDSNGLVRIVATKKPNDSRYII